MQRPPTVSILTPTYNHERFIGSCIESALAQTFSNWEMIVVDDGSTDSTAGIVSSYSDPRIRLVCQQNVGIGGLAQTYNRALAESTAGLVAILEGDDFWPVDKLALQVADFDEPTVVLSSGFAAVVDTDGNFLSKTPDRSPPPFARTNRPVGKAVAYMAAPTTLTYTWPVATVLRRSALDEVGGFIQPQGLPIVDLPTFLSIATKGEFRFHDETLGSWRRHSTSTTSAHLPAILDEAYRFIFRFLREVRPKLSLSDSDLDALELEWEHFQVLLCLLRGRMLSSQKSFRLARKAFGQVFLYRRTRRSDFAAKAAVALSFLNLPVEWLFRASGRPSWQEINNLPAGDFLTTPDDLDRPRLRFSWRE